MPGMTDPEGLPRGIGRPATGALLAAGYTDLAQLAGVPAADLLRLHGVGPKAVRVLGEALAERGLSLS
jgi:predicted flap endonuclease-1-like 5' DNA nuclease